VADKSKDPDRDTTTVMMFRVLAKQIRTIADHRNETMCDTFQRIAGRSVLREYRKVLEELNEQVVGGEG
jgi:hypothetical protein